MSTLVNKLMMGADAWAQLANQHTPGLTPQASQALYQERMDRARAYRQHADVVAIHACDALALIDLLEVACDEIISEQNRTSPVNGTCATLPGPHNPDGTCCPPPAIPCDAHDDCCGALDRSGEMR